MRRVQETITDSIALDSESEPIGIDDEAELPPLVTVSLTRREYIHSPGYVDEVVARVDISPVGGANHGADRPAWVIQDANSNLVGLVGDDGTLLHQYTWDPYEEPVAIERFDTGSAGTSLAPFENRIGHQGLFFDRFDGGVNNVLLPPLWVDAGTGLAARGLYQNGNRSYSPSLGRFVQRDPNGTSQLIRHSAFFGSALMPLVRASSVESLYGDGVNVYAYLGSAPISRSDPLGLFIAIGMGIGATQSIDLYTDYNEEANEASYSLEDFLINMVCDYADDQEDDLRWAMNWKQDDFAHSKSGSAAALLLGAKPARAKGLQTHHIAVTEGEFGERNRRLFESCGMSLEDKANKIPVPHGGRHSREYKKWIFDELEESVEHIPRDRIEQRRAALKTRLNEVGTFIKKKPEVMYNTVRGKPTGWKGKRGLGIWRR